MHATSQSLYNVSQKTDPCDFFGITLRKQADDAQFFLTENTTKLLPTRA